MSRQDHSPLLELERDTFLDELADGATIKAAAAKAGRHRQTFYRLKANDRSFSEAWDIAYDEGTDHLEAEAQRRAVDGVADFRLDREGAEHAFTRYSDTLLIFLLKARRPAKFRDTYKVEHTGDPDKPVVLEHRGVKLSDVLDVARKVGLEPGD